MLNETLLQIIDFLSSISNWLLTFSDNSWAFIFLKKNEFPEKWESIWIGRINKNTRYNIFPINKVENKIIKINKQQEENKIIKINKQQEENN